MGLGNGTCHLVWRHLRVGVDGFPIVGLMAYMAMGSPPGARAADAAGTARWVVHCSWLV